jgi:hypothetical protein
MAEQQTIPKQSHEQAWPAEGLTRVPYRVFQTEEFYRTEQQRIFHGPSWHYLALEVEPQSSESRVTEASVRGFWKAYRSNMGLVRAGRQR